MQNNGLQICLIDDDQIYQFAAKKIIESTGLAQRVTAFSNGRDALGYLEKNAAFSEVLPDVIFVDVNMPLMTGWQFLDAFNSLKTGLAKKVTIYVVSSSVDELDITKSKSYHTVSDYIIKPVHKDRFESLLTSLTRGDIFLDR